MAKSFRTAKSPGRDVLTIFLCLVLRMVIGKGKISDVAAEAWEEFSATCREACCYTAAARWRFVKSRWCW